MNIVLAGMPGSGKTTVAYRLADLLDVDMVDTDALIVKHYGKISDIFARHGEACFRDMETAVVKEVSEMKDTVISTGGGCLMREENVNYFKNTQAKIVFLKTKFETLVRRIDGDDTRPLLQGGAQERLQALLASRTPVYESVADVVVETDGLKPQEVAQAIAEKLK